jgi:hypothetical protein
LINPEANDMIRKYFVLRKLLGIAPKIRVPMSLF